MSETVLVTGGCGFIGSCFVLQQMKQYPDIRLINLDALTYAGNPDNVKDVAGGPRYTFVQADVADRPAVEAVFAQYHPTLVVHFATRSLLAVTARFYWPWFPAIAGRVIGTALKRLVTGKRKLARAILLAVFDPGLAKDPDRARKRLDGHAVPVWPKGD